MKFFTRDLYNSFQYNPTESTKEERDIIHNNWIKITDQYNNHYNSIYPYLSENVQLLSKYSFHDAVVISHKNEANEFILDINTKNCPWLSINSEAVNITFKNVKFFEKKGNINNDYWLYEEIDLAEDKFFEYRVLFQNSEFRLIAKDVNLK